MGLLQNQAIRLLREDWPDATELAEELFAIFNADDPVETGPLSTTIPQDSTQPAQVINNYSPGSTLFQIKGPGGAPVGDIKIVNGNLVFDSAPTKGVLFPPFKAESTLNIGGFPGSSFSTGNIAGSQLTFTAPDVSTRSSTTPVDPGTQKNSQSPPSPPPPPPPATMNLSYPAQVLDGSGSVYTAEIYPNGAAGGALRVSVTQLQIADGQQIPAGTWTLVTKTTDGRYWMQVPIWGL